MSKHERLTEPPTGPHAVEDLGEGYNPAWWTVAVLGILAGAVGAWAVVVLSPALGIVSGVLAVLTAVVGVIMTRMGLGTYANASADTAADSESLGIK